MKVNVKKSIQCLIPHYVVRESISPCSCHADDVYECMPDIYLTVDNCTGYGSAFWTYTDETCPSGVDDHGKAYYCTFQGLVPFWACGETDIAEKLREKLDMASQPASVNYVYNKKAESLIEEIKQQASVLNK